MHYVKLCEGYDSLGYLLATWVIPEEQVRQHEAPQTVTSNDAMWFGNDGNQSAEVIRAVSLSELLLAWVYRNAEYGTWDENIDGMPCLMKSVGDTPNTG